MGDNDPGGDLEGEVGGDDGVVVEASAVHDVGQPHQGRVPHVQRGVVEGVAETVQRPHSIASDPGKSIFKFAFTGKFLQLYRFVPVVLLLLVPL